MHLEGSSSFLEHDFQQLDGKTAIVTGANSGLGKEITKQLAKKGCRVIMACRSDHLGLVTRKELLNNLEIRTDDLVCMTLDLGSLASVRKFTDEFSANEAHLNILINNAAVFSGKEGRSLTMDGFETHFGVNHLGHFLLTLLLLDKMKASAPARIVNVTCDVHRYGKLDLEDLNLHLKWSAFRAYAKSKTANMLFTVALASRLADTGVSAFAVSPGIILNHTQILRNVEKHKANILKCVLKMCFFYQFKCVTQGADAILHCCVDENLEENSGCYISSDLSILQPKHLASDPDIAQQLWRLSEEMVGLRKKSIRRK